MLLGAGGIFDRSPVLRAREGSHPGLLRASRYPDAGPLRGAIRRREPCRQPCPDPGAQPLRLRSRRPTACDGPVFDRQRVDALSHAVQARGFRRRRTTQAANTAPRARSIADGSRDLRYRPTARPLAQWPDLGALPCPHSARQRRCRSLWPRLLADGGVRVGGSEDSNEAAVSRVMSNTMRVVSGIQPTGDLHLGNLLGAILRWVRMQDEAECLYFLADLHALTVDVDPAELRSNVREMAAALIASGIDPKKSILFLQSALPAHSELAWILQGTARMGWLNRMTQWKDKAGKDREGKSVGLFTYPVLQAADILLYRATHVPVGEDQKQHVELTRDIALKFNTDFDTDLFVAPQPFIGGGTAARVMSLRDGMAKMSKSDPSEMSRINLVDDDDTIAQKIRKAKTDAEPLPDDPALLDGRSEARNLVGIYGAVTGESIEAVLGRFAAQASAPLKPALADALIALLKPLRTRLEQLRGDPAELDRILADGAARAAALGAPTLAAAYDAVGLSH